MVSWTCHFSRFENYLFSAKTMATILLVKEAITALKDRTGSSVPAIMKWIESEKKVRRKLYYCV